MRKRMIASLAGFVTGACFLFGCTRAPTPSESNTTPIEAGEGYLVDEPLEEEGIPVNKGILESVIPMVGFDCSGRVYKKKRDNQDGVECSVTLAFGTLADSAVFDYLLSDGRMNKKFDDGFLLNTQYFRSHVAAFYAIPATQNLKKVLKTIKVGDPIRLTGHLVYLQTKNGRLTTSLNPNEFKCKYAYITEITTGDSIYR